MKQTLGESGQITTVNVQQPEKVRTHLVSYDVPVVPSKPQESLPPIETLDSSLRTTIDVVRAYFEERPSWTRRAIRNLLPSPEQRYLLRHAIPYIGYIFRSGPWRDAIIKLGHDPRTSPEYRHYQTFMFRTLPREAEVARDGGSGRRHHVTRPEDQRKEADGLAGYSSETATSDSHIFKCQLPFPRDGRIWQVCDIKDPVVNNILYPHDPPEGFLRPTCEIISDGWFGNGTLAKAKTIMRFKIQALIDNRMPEDTGFERILDLPEHAYSEADIVRFQVDPEVATNREVIFATEIRSAIKGAANWRSKTDKERQDEETRGRRATRLKNKKDEVDEHEQDNVAQELSEGEEEEMERAEMLEDQVVAALAVRDAAELEAQDDNEDDNAGGEEDEIE